MGMFDDPNPSHPGGQGLIRFPDQIRWHLRGDERRADTFRGAALQLKAGLDQGNINALKQWSARRQYDDGTVIEVRKSFCFYDIQVYCPHEAFSRQDDQPQLILPLQSGAFYYVPGCVARYGFREGDELFNEIPVSINDAGSVDTSNMGIGVAFQSLKEAGLPPPGTSPDGSISRMYRTCRLDGANPESGLGGALVVLSAWHLPTEGPFTISCVVRLRQEILADYSFTSKTQELDNGYTIWNPIKPRFLRSSDGVNWAAECPGSLAPLIGYKIPTWFSRHWTRFTLPWPPYNNNFTTRDIKWIGYQEIATVCDGEPLLASADTDSPYWDRVQVGTLETLAGEFVVFWEENTLFENTAPYASFSKFRTAGMHPQNDGRRVVGALADGAFRYATVVSCDYEYEGSSVTATVITLKDYQYKRHIAEASPSLVFGDQPFPVCHPEGYMIGMNIMGLCWYNGNRILAGKVCDFESEYTNQPVISAPLPLDVWHHVLMTYEKGGKTTLYINKFDSDVIHITTGHQSESKFINQNGFGGLVPISVAADGWISSPNHDVSFADDYSSWVSSSFMDIGLLRIYHRAISKSEAQLLTRELFDGVFVADDHEAAQLAATGLTPMVV